MWNPPIALSPEEQKIVARTRKTRKCFVFLRERRHELLDADFQHTLAQSYSAEPGGKAPVAAAMLALATLLQAYCHVGDRDAVERTVMDKRWQMVLDCLGTEQPPFSQGTLYNFRRRLIAHNLDKTLLERTVALAEKTGGFGSRPLRAVLDSTPLFGAGRVEDTLNLLGHALRKAVGLVAQELGRSAEAIVEDAGLTLVGHSSLKAALDLDWGEPRARERALSLVLEEVERWQRWLEQQQTLAAQKPPLKEVMETITQIITQDTEPDPGGGAGGRRLKPHVAPDRRISIEDHEMRHGRKSSAKAFNGFQAHFAVDLDSNVIREVVVCPANAPEHEAVALLAEELDKAPGLLQRDIDLGYMASPRIAQWAEQGVYKTLSGIVYNDCMLTYTALQDRPREFLAATGLTHAECAHLLPAFATAYALLYPPEKTVEGKPRQRRAGGGPRDLATDGRQTAFYPRLSKLLLYKPCMAYNSS